MASAHLKMKIDPKKSYSAKEAADFLEVSEDTVKDYCRRKKLPGKQVGPKKRWHVLGTSILKQRKDWDMDDLSS